MRNHTHFWRIPLERTRLRRDLGHVEWSLRHAGLVENDDANVGRVGTFVVPQRHRIVALVRPLGRPANQHDLVVQLLERDAIVFFHFFWSLKTHTPVAAHIHVVGQHNPSTRPVRDAMTDIADIQSLSWSHPYCLV